MKKEDLNQIIDSAPAWLQNLANLYPPSFAVKHEVANAISKANLKLISNEETALIN